MNFVGDAEEIWNEYQAFMEAYDLSGTVKSFSLDNIIESMEDKWSTTLSKSSNIVTAIQS